MLINQKKKVNNLKVYQNVLTTWKFIVRNTLFVTLRSKENRSKITNYLEDKEKETSSLKIL